MYLKDEQLISQTLQGDGDAFRVLVERYQERVYAYTLGQLRNPTDAQDVVQEIFLRVYRHLDQLRHPHLFRTWLYTIVSNECNRWLVRVTQKRQRELPIELVEETEQEDAVLVTPEHTLPTTDWEVDLEEAISNLSDDNRVAISMFYMSKCTMKEIAEFLGVSVNTVKGKLFRARKQLERELGKYDSRRKPRPDKLEGALVMSVMKQIDDTPAATISFIGWISIAAGKAVGSLMTTLCILAGGIGILAGGIDENKWNGTEEAIPIEIVLIRNPNRRHISATAIRRITPEEKRPTVAPAGASTEPKQGENNRRGADATPQLAPAIAENESEKRIFSGHVIDSDGLRVANVEILFPIGAQPLHSVACTKADGTFRFELSCSEGLSEQVHIVATHPDYAFGWQKVSSQGTTDVRLQLSTPSGISGKIMNEAGEPIQNSEIQIQHLFSSAAMRSGSKDRLGMDNIPIFPVQTDANGAFVFRKLPKDTNVSLSVSHGRSHKIFKDIAVNERNLVLTLTPPKSKD